MPIVPTYPGVYVEETPGGVPSSVGVATSIAAFVDTFRRGLLNAAVRISSYGELEREFGGLDESSAASYGVQQFFLNGGRDVYVVRVGTDPIAAAAALLTGVDGDIVNARAGHRIGGKTELSPGTWGNAIQVEVDHDTALPDPSVDPTGVEDPAELFNLTVVETEAGSGGGVVRHTEAFQNLTMRPGTLNYAIEVVNAGSRLIQLDRDGLVAIPVPFPITFRPEEQRQALAGGADSGALDAGALRGVRKDKTGLFALEDVDLFNILCLPAAAELGDSDMRTVYAAAEAYCEERRAFLIVDLPPGVRDVAAMETWLADNETLRHRNAAVYFPRVHIRDPLNQNQLRSVAASGTMAGLYASTDLARGVWKAPAGRDARLLNVQGLDYGLTGPENDSLNRLGINCLRHFMGFGYVAWGSRTLDGADQSASEWKYVPVRRLALFLEESINRGIEWAVFEPNDERLWARIRVTVGNFMQDLFRQGALQGRTPQEGYVVKCDATTTTQADIDGGVVNVLVGFAPLKPAEFVVILIQQLAGKIPP